MRYSIYLSLVAFASTALAHGGVTFYTINGKTYPGFVKTPFFLHSASPHTPTHMNK
jgi:hypothetical protein